MAGSLWLRHMFSSRMVQPGLSSRSRTRPSSTCSLNAITRSVSSPPLVMRPAPMRMRLPLAPATLRAGGRISAGMISTVQMPLPILAAIAPSDWPQRCAPSPESLMISTMCSLRVTTGFSACSIDVVSFMVGDFILLYAARMRAKLCCWRSSPNMRPALPRPSIAYGWSGSRMPR